MPRKQTAEEKEAAQKARARRPFRCCANHGLRDFNTISWSRTSIDTADAPSRTIQECTQLMLQNGWCIHQVVHLSRKYSIETLSHLATLEVPEARKVDHARCNRFRACVAYNADLQNYKTRHVADDCDCSIIQTPYQELLDILKSGHIPLVSVETLQGDSGDDDLRIKVCPRSISSKYIAISHVWADGLGNPSVNGLPVCQLKQLRTSISALQRVMNIDTGSCLFWMDTLCIPVGPNELALKLVQIDKMSSIYVGAVSSLVLDAELMSTTVRMLRRQFNTAASYRNQPLLEINAYCRLACSIWMTRSWTLQEGFLPPTISVQYRNRLVVLGRTSQSDGQYCEKVIRCATGMVDHRASLLNAQKGESMTSQDLQDQHKELGTSPKECSCVSILLEKELFDTFHSDRRTFASTWNELAGRSTTMPTDVPMIMTNMLGLENRALLKCHTSSEMFQTIILSQTRVPLSLFFNTGFRSDAIHNRWVPNEIGSHIMTTTPQVSVHRNHFLYEHTNPFSDSRKPGNVSVYVFPGLLPLSGGVPLTLHCRKEATTYVLEAEEVTAAHVRYSNGTTYTTSYVVIENDTTGDENKFLRGAVFFGTAITSESRVRGARETITVEHVAAVTFVCPARLRRFSGVDRSHIPAFQDSHLQIHLREDSLTLKIRHGKYSSVLHKVTYGYLSTPDSIDANTRHAVNLVPPANFKALKKRPKPTFAAQFTESVVWFGIFTIMGIEAIAMLLVSQVFSVQISATIVALFYFTGLILGLGVAVAAFWLILLPRGRRRAEWNLVKSFEEIAAGRRATATA